MWIKIKSKEDIPEYKDVVYLYDCMSKGIGKLVWVDNEARVVDSCGKVKSSYGHRIIAYMEIPKYV